MGFYNRYILPKLINCGCAASPVSKQRAKIVPLAKGDVLEVGLGTGFNLPFYDGQQVNHLWGLEPVGKMLQQVEDKLRTSPLPFQVDLLESGAENIRLEDNSVDTIVMTYTLCSIPQVAQAMSEMKRVLKPDGQLLFCEHGAAPDDGVLKWQNRINPIWKRIGGGCNLNRRIPDLIKQGGFEINDLQSMYIPGWKPACFNYWGKASLKQ